MPRMNDNRLGEMAVFVDVVERGGFSAAGRFNRMTPSAVSKLMTRLEERLGVRLLTRNTRRAALTDEGLRFYNRAKALLSDVEEAERAISADARPTGVVRISANVPFGRRFLIPLLPAFQKANPDVRVEASLTDAVIDLVEERTDIAVRAGPLEHPGLIARKLGETRRIAVASPAYLAELGPIERPHDLARCVLLDFTYRRTEETWPFVDNQGSPVDIRPDGRYRVSDGDAMRALCLEGLGVARLARFQVEEDLAAGRLTEVLPEQTVESWEAFHAVFLGASAHMPARVRAILAMLVAHVGPQMERL